MEEGNLIDKLTAVTILDERIFLNLLEIEDEVDQQRELLALQSRAAELGKKDRMLETMFPMVEKHGVFKAMESISKTEKNDGTGAEHVFG